jgi:hypothetical protein
MAQVPPSLEGWKTRFFCLERALEATQKLIFNCIADGRQGNGTQPHCAD